MFQYHFQMNQAGKACQPAIRFILYTSNQSVSQTNRPNWT